MISGVLPYLTFFENFYDKPDALKKIKYIKTLSKMLSDMVRMTDFSVEKLTRDTMINRAEIANILKESQDPYYTLRNIPDELKAQYQDAIDDLPRRDKMKIDEQSALNTLNNNTKFDYISENFRDKKLPDVSDFDDDDEIFKGNDILSEDDVPDNGEFFDDEDVENYEEDDDMQDNDFGEEAEDDEEEDDDDDEVVFNADKSLKPVPENDPSQFNYKQFHAKLIEYEKKLEKAGKKKQKDHKHS